MRGILSLEIGQSGIFVIVDKITATIILIKNRVLQVMGLRRISLDMGQSGSYSVYQTQVRDG